MSASDFIGTYWSRAEATATLLQAAPALIEAFAGAPVLAELETGTFRYAWTQGFGRWRWTLAALAIGALAGMLIRRVVPAIAATLAVKST